jgi:hypothetical protein
MANISEEQLRVSALSFDDIKTSLKEFLRNQDEFTGYDFEGSALNVLLDVLAYNTHYSGFYNNMAASEMFLDSAKLRSSAVSIAKQLGYTPRSRTSSKAKINVTLTASSTTNSLILDPYTTFKTSLNGVTYTFCNLNKIVGVAYEWDDSTGTPTKWKTDDFIIHEGKVKTTSFVNDAFDNHQKFVVENFNIDTSTIEIHVKPSLDASDDNLVLWERSTDITELGPVTKKYTIEETTDGFFHVSFGDGVIGEALVDGAVVQVKYLESNGQLLNGSGTTFTRTGLTVVVVDTAYGGGEREDVASIKFTAPKAYATQERAVTVEDYKALVKKDFSTVDTVEAWGGEENDPPAYGKVFLSIKPKQGTKLSNSEKLDIIKNITANRNIVGVSVEVVDPEYKWILVDLEVWWNDNNTTKKQSDLKSAIRGAVLSYRDDVLRATSADTMFSEVDFKSQIKKTDSSITTVTLNTQIQKRIALTSLGLKGTTINTKEELLHPHDGHESILTSNKFSHKNKKGKLYDSCSLYDDGYGTLNVYYHLGTTKTSFDFSVGTIDYSTGQIKLNKYFSPISLSRGMDLRLNVVPKYNSFKPLQNVILDIDSLDEGSIIINTKSG